MANTRIDYLTAQQGYERAILATFSTATVSQIVDGKKWYPTATSALLEYSNVWPLEVCAAVCAILSPRNSWKQNLEGVRRIARDVSQGRSWAPVVAGVRRNVAKAWETANDGDVFRVTGPKVSAFYQNLLGNLQRVTIDVWAARAAGVPDAEMTHLDRTRYVTLERAYQNVARELGFLPAELQAICWIVQRGHGEGTMGGTNQPRWAKGGE